MSQYYDTKNTGQGIKLKRRRFKGMSDEEATEAVLASQMQTLSVPALPWLRAENYFKAL